MVKDHFIKIHINTRKHSENKNKKIREKIKKNKTKKSAAEQRTQEVMNYFI
jgi:hypothetical protein